MFLRSTSQRSLRVHRRSVALQEDQGPDVDNDSSTPSTQVDTSPWVPDNQGGVGRLGDSGRTPTRTLKPTVSDDTSTQMFHWQKGSCRTFGRSSQW